MKVAKLGTVDASGEETFLWISGHIVKGQLLVLENKMIFILLSVVNSLTYDRLLDGYQTCYSG